MIGRKLLDRYLLISELGRGGISTVYRAEDQRLSRQVAIKVLTQADSDDSQGHQRLLHEAQAAAVLDHPNIVTIHDVAESDGLPFIVMQLIEGETLKQKRFKSLDEIISVAQQIAAALDYAHNQGIIHRDIKPANVMISAGNVVSLMDFGLARSLSSQISYQGGITGTLDYISPEQIAGGDIDGRADLYSLGVLLYELTTGQLPFAAENPVSLLTQHLYAPVVPPRARNGAISPALNHLIISLLQKDPDDRPASAADVDHLLESVLELEADPGGAVKSELSVLERIARGRMVGREKELSEARSIWNKALSAQGLTLLISGEPGIGKTRLVRELTTLAEVTGGRAFIGVSYPEGGAPYSPFSQIVHKVFSAGPDGLHLPNFVMAEMLNLAPELALDYQDVTPNPQLEPQAGRRRLFDAFTLFCRDLSGQRPLLMVLEDVHWADEGTLSLLRHLARQVQEQPLLLIATYRELELDRNRPLNQVLMTMQRERLAHRLKLTRLDQQGTRSMLEELFTEEISSEFLEIIYRETEGNPYFIEEVSKSLVESGDLHFEDGVWRRPDLDELSIPQTVRVAIQSRIMVLEPDVQDVLQLAAIIGREFDYETLSAAESWDEKVIINALDRAERAQLIEEISSSQGGTFSFAHALIPATLVEELSGLRQRYFHRSIAQVIEKQHPDELAKLAFHFRLAQDQVKALFYLMKAGDRARAQFANEDALRLYSQALEFVVDDTERFDLLLARVQVFHLTADRESELADVDELLELADGLGDEQRKIDALLAQAEFFLETEHIKSHEPSKQAAEMARRVDDPAREAQALRFSGTAYWFAGDFNQSQKDLRASAELFRGAGLPGEAAASLHTLSLTLGSLGDKEEALKIAVKALEESRQASDIVQEANSLRRIAIAYYTEDRNEEALPYALEALELHRKLGDRSQEVNALNALGVIYCNLDETDSGFSCLEQSLSLAEEIDSIVGIQFAIFNFSIELLKVGQYQESWDFATKKCDQYSQHEDRWLVGWLHNNLAVAAFVIGDLDRSIVEFDKALHLLDGIQPPSSQGLMLAQQAAIITEVGDFTGAMDKLETAEALTIDGEDLDSRAIVNLNLAYWHLLKADDLNTGLDFAEQALIRLKSSYNVPNLANALFVKARLLIALEEVDHALEAVDKLTPLLDTTALIFRPQRCYYTAYLTYKAAAEEAQAKNALQLAYDFVQSISRNLTDDHLRRCWLINIPDNPHIIDEAEVRGIAGP